jgi:RNA polymerase sigma-B factor
VFRLTRTVPGSIAACVREADAMCHDGQPPLIRRVDLLELPDATLLARLRLLPLHSDERSVLCTVLVERYAGMVRSCVRPYRRSPVPTEDLIQVGYVGLLKAINNYDPEAGESLSAYARPCIIGEIKRYFRDKRWQVRVSRHAQELLLEMRAVNEELTQQLGRSPADRELAQRLGVAVDEIADAQHAALVFTAFSLDAPLSDREDPGQLADLMGEDDGAVEHAMDMEALRSHLDELPEREQRILAMRYWGNLTQAEIGARLGVSQMHVSRLLNRSLAHLRDRLTAEPADGPPLSRPPAPVTGHGAR